VFIETHPAPNEALSDGPNDSAAEMPKLLAETLGDAGMKLAAQSSTPENEIRNNNQCFYRSERRKNLDLRAVIDPGARVCDAQHATNGEMPLKLFERITWLANGCGSQSRAPCHRSCVCGFKLPIARGNHA